MAEKRMFAKSIVLSDAFLDMPMSARCLYFTLGMLADDDGFVGAPKSIMRQCGASQDDLAILITKRFVLTFETGVIVIKHWRINNYLRQDRYTETTYREEKASLSTDAKGAYTEVGIPPGIPPGIPSIDKSREDKDSTEEISKEEDICAEPVPASAPDPPENIVTTLLLNDGTAYPVGELYIKQMQALFPNVNVWQEVLKMSAWCINNPKKRKTRKGITRFINNWLSGEQDKGARRAQISTADNLQQSYRMMEDWAHGQN